MAYAIGKRLVCPISNRFIRKLRGFENIPKDRNFIAAANHESYLDHLFVVCTLTRKLNKKIHFLSKKEHFDSPIKSAWHTYAGAIPLDREAGGKEALRWAIKALKEGKIIAIHPEGTRTTTGKLMKGKTGIARLALEAKVPILPIGIIGTYKILPKGKFIPKLLRAEMNIGKLMYFDKYYMKKVTKQLLRKVTDEIMKEIARLSRQKYEF